jgi:formate hydrogenlyase subunit 3/multisubunit Na+/H+ antiporter MnhD subunit
MMRIGTILIIAILLVLLGASAWFAYDGLTVGDDTAVSGHAYVAMGLGIFFSLVIGVGLMVLLFYSSRSGYDEPPKLIDDNKNPSE